MTICWVSLCLVDVILIILVKKKNSRSRAEVEDRSEIWRLKILFTLEARWLIEGIYKKLCKVSKSTNTITK